MFPAEGQTMKNHFFDVFMILILAALLLISCSDTDPYSVEGRIDAVVPSEDGLTALVTIEGRTFLFTPDTLYKEMKSVENPLALADGMKTAIFIFSLIFYVLLKRS